MSRFFTACVASFLVLSISAVACAYNLTWIGTTGNWSDVTNWFTSESGWMWEKPTSSDRVTIYDGIAIINTDDELCDMLCLGSDYGGTVQMTDGSLTTNQEIIGYNGEGIFTQTGGSNNISLGLSVGYGDGNGTYNLIDGTLSVGDSIYISSYYKGIGIFNQSGGLVESSNMHLGKNYTPPYPLGQYAQTGGTNAISGSLYVGERGSGSYELSEGVLTAECEYIAYGDFGTGTFTQTSGSNIVTYLYAGYDSSSTGTYMLSGTGELTAQSEQIGIYSTGTFDQSGGTNATMILCLGVYADSEGYYNLSGAGQLTAATEYVGLLGKSTFTQTGGVNTVTSNLVLANNEGSTGTYNLNGGTLVTASLSAGSGTAAFNFGGGTLRASGDIISYVDMTLTGTSGNAMIDSNGHDLCLYGDLSGAGGLVKDGVGSLSLSGASDYAGTTTVNQGTLTLSMVGTFTMDINSEGESSLICGDGALICGGTLIFDLTDVTDVFAKTVIDIDSLDESFTSGFNVEFLVGEDLFEATEYNDGVWMYTIDSLGSTALFIESTGILTVTPVPEPSTLTLLAAGLVGAAIYMSRKRKNRVC